MTSRTDNHTDLLIHNFCAYYPVESWKRAGFFSDDYLQLINRHWLQFPPASAASHYLLAALYTIIMVVGVFGNMLVIVMHLRCRSLRTPASFLVVNLAVSDFFMIAKTPVFIYNSVRQGPALGAFGCQVYGFVGALTGTVSIATLAAIALDRYLVISYPLDPLKRTTKCRASVCIAVCWVYGLVFASAPLLGISHYVPEGYLTSCSFDYLAKDYTSRVFIIVFFCAAWVLPFFIIAFSYICICVRVINIRAGTTYHASRFHNQQRRTEIKLSIVVIAIIGVWFAAWTPYAIVALLGYFGYNRILLPSVSMVPALFCKAASCLDPFIYAVSHPRFRRELLKCMTKTSLINKKKSQTTVGKLLAVETRCEQQELNCSSSENEHRRGNDLYMIDMEQQVSSHNDDRIRDIFTSQNLCSEYKAPENIKATMFAGKSATKNMREGSVARQQIPQPTNPTDLCQTTVPRSPPENHVVLLKQQIAARSETHVHMTKGQGISTTTVNGVTSIGTKCLPDGKPKCVLRRSLSY